MKELAIRYTELLSEIRHPNVMRLFRFLAYAWMFFNALYFFPIRHQMWGEYSMIMSFHPEQSVTINFAYLLDHQRALALPAFYAYIISIALAVVGIGGRLVRMVVFFLSWLLYYACVPAFNSSFLLFNIFSFFLMFFGRKGGGPIDAIFSNIAFWACRVQFLLVYSIAGGYKLTGQTWLNGSSLWYALHLDHFTRPWLLELMKPMKGVLMALTYFGVIYQLVFPFLVWFKRIKTPLFIAGILFHAFIGIGMRLPEFGLAMIVGYSLFMSEETAEKVVRKLRLKA
ncbi:MAG: HTTM domain-containing protein [Flavobacteriales bacterium]|nr:HTTM domain-containing protein [Flavobacteriales bacterium]